jgi:hypothetical protein
MVYPWQSGKSFLEVNSFCHRKGWGIGAKKDVETCLEIVRVTIAKDYDLLDDGSGSGWNPLGHGVELKTKAIGGADQVIVNVDRHGNIRKIGPTASKPVINVAGQSTSWLRLQVTTAVKSSVDTILSKAFWEVPSGDICWIIWVDEASEF